MYNEHHINIRIQISFLRIDICFLCTQNHKFPSITANSCIFKGVNFSFAHRWQSFLSAKEKCIRFQLRTWAARRGRARQRQSGREHRSEWHSIGRFPWLWIIRYVLLRRAETCHFYMLLGASHFYKAISTAYTRTHTLAERVSVPSAKLNKKLQPKLLLAWWL